MLPINADNCRWPSVRGFIPSWKNSDDTIILKISIRPTNENYIGRCVFDGTWWVSKLLHLLFVNPETRNQFPMPPYFGFVGIYRQNRANYDVICVGVTCNSATKPWNFGFFLHKRRYCEWRQLWFVLSLYQTFWH